MKGVMSLLIVLMLSGLAMAAVTSTTNTNFNVVYEDVPADGYVSAVDSSTDVSSVEESMNYTLYWIALIIVVAIVFFFWKLNKRDIAKKRAKGRKKSKKKSTTGSSAHPKLRSSGAKKSK